MGFSANITQPGADPELNSRHLIPISQRPDFSPRHADRPRSSSVWGLEVGEGLVALTWSRGQPPSLQPQQPGWAQSTGVANPEDRRGWEVHVHDLVVPCLFSLSLSLF